MTWFDVLKTNDCRMCPKCGEPMKRKGKGWRKQVGEWYCPKCGDKKKTWHGPRTPTPPSHRGRDVFE